MRIRQLIDRVQEVYPDSYVDSLGNEWVVYENSNQAVLMAGKSVKEAWQKLFNQLFPDEAAIDSTDSYL